MITAKESLNSLALPPLGTISNESVYGLDVYEYDYFNGECSPVDEVEFGNQTDI